MLVIELKRVSRAAVISKTKNIGVDGERESSKDGVVGADCGKFRRREGNDIITQSRE